MNSQHQPEQRPLVTWLIRIALIAGCAFTGMHNYALYFRGLNGTLNPTARNAVSLAIAFILEAAFYFSVEGRGRVFVTEEQRNASAWGALLIFGVIALNTITDHSMNIGAIQAGDWLNAWATYGAAAAVVAIVGYIGYLKAYSPEAMMMAAAAQAEHAKVLAYQKIQTAVLTDPQVQAQYTAAARQWAVANVQAQTQGVARTEPEKTQGGGSALKPSTLPVRAIPVIEPSKHPNA
jgi:hypothetical protein